MRAFSLGAILIAAVGLFVGSVLVSQEQDKQPEQTGQVGQVGKTAVLRVGNERYEADVMQGQSLYDFMVSAQGAQGLRFDGGEFAGIGFFVEEINGVRQAPEKGMYWVYLVNGEKANMGISQYKVQAGDVIEWSYEAEE